MKKVLLLAAAAALAFAGQASAADKKVLAIVVKGLDNAFFEAIHQGCEKWNSENASSEYTCFYTGPASTSDEAGEAQIVSDLLAKPDTTAIAISPSNAQLIAQTITERFMRRWRGDPPPQGGRVGRLIVPARTPAARRHPRGRTRLPRRA